MLTVGFSELRSNLATVTQRVVEDGESTDKREWLQLFSNIIDEYPTVFERLAE